MSFTNGDITTDEQTFLAADKPLLSSRNSAEDQTASEWNEVGTVAAVNRDDPDFPPSNAVDTYQNIQTTPLGAVSNEWYLILTLPAGVEYDWLGLFGHTLGDIGGTPLVEYQIDDTGPFPTPDTLTSFSPTATPTGKQPLRLISYDLDGTLGVGTAQRITGSHFARIRITNGGGPTFVPAIGELVLGRRRQLEHQPNRPWGPDNVKRISRFFTGGAGGLTNHVDAEQLFHYIGAIEAASQIRIDDLVALRKESKGFTRPMIWTNLPSTKPSEAIWMWQDMDDFSFNEIGPQDRIWPFDLSEDGDVPLSLEL